MIINKVRISDHFHLALTVTSTAEVHGKFSDKETEINSIINAEMDALKFKLKSYLESIPNKVG